MTMEQKIRWEIKITRKSGIGSFLQKWKHRTEGMYNNKGNAQGEWKWYFNNGNELLTQGLQGWNEGLLMEYNDTGK